MVCQTGDNPLGQDFGILQWENEAGLAVLHHFRHPPDIGKDRWNPGHGCLSGNQRQCLDLRGEHQCPCPAIFLVDFDPRQTESKLDRQPTTQEPSQPASIPVVPSDHLETGGRHLPEHEGERPKQPGKPFSEKIAPHEQDQVFPFLPGSPRDSGEIEAEIEAQVFARVVVYLVHEPAVQDYPVDMLK